MYILCTLTEINIHSFMGINCPVLHCEAPVIRHEAPIRSENVMRYGQIEYFV
jgi:hypothetical protein